MRAMTFERLVRDERFASEVATTTVGRLDLDRPTKVVIANARGNVDRTASLLADAHDRAVAEGRRDVIHGLAVPFVGFEDDRATDVKPDFAVVAPKTKRRGRRIVADRRRRQGLRARPVPHRRRPAAQGLPPGRARRGGFAAWSQLPAGMDVHRSACSLCRATRSCSPRRSSRTSTDHREEVAMRVAERQAEAKLHSVRRRTLRRGLRRAPRGDVRPGDLLVVHAVRVLPRRTASGRHDPTDLLIELGIPRERPTATWSGWSTGPGWSATPPASVVAHGHRDGQRRRVSAPGSSASTRRAAGHGQRRDREVRRGRARRPRARVPARHARRAGRLDVRPLRRPAVAGDAARRDEAARGRRSRAAMTDAAGQPRSTRRRSTSSSRTRAPPTCSSRSPTTSPASSSAACGGSATRTMGRPRADVRRRAGTHSRRAHRRRTGPAVSFLLEEDRARALSLRSPIVDVRAVLARHVVAGGPAVNSLPSRLPRRVGRRRPTPVDHRAFGDDDRGVGAHARRPADEHDAPTRSIARARRRPAQGRGDSPTSATLRPARPRGTRVQDRRLRRAARRSRTVARRRACGRRTGRSRATPRPCGAARLSLHASDLVRFGRTYRRWRNSLVPTIETRRAGAHAQLLALTNPQAAHDAATDAGTRQIAFATVVAVNRPLVLEVDSRRSATGAASSCCTSTTRPASSHRTVDVDASQKGSFKIDGLAIGPLSRRRRRRHAPVPLRLGTRTSTPALAVGDELVVADFDWFSTDAEGQPLPAGRPPAAGHDRRRPKPDCTATSYDDDPADHRCCCRPHEARRGRVVRRARRPAGARGAQPAGVAAGRRRGRVRGVGGGRRRSATRPPTPREPAPDDVTLDDLE